MGHEKGEAYVKGEEDEGPTGQTEAYHTGPYPKNTSPFLRNACPHLKNHLQHHNCLHHHCHHHHCHHQHHHQHRQLMMHNQAHPVTSSSSSTSSLPSSPTTSSSSSTHYAPKWSLPTEVLTPDSMANHQV